MYYALYLLASLKQNDAKERYLNKIKEINGQDPYEIPKCEWEDDVESWPDVSYIHVGMYLLFSSSPYTKEQLMNYKSLDCYQNFAGNFKQKIWRKLSSYRKGKWKYLSKVFVRDLPYAYSKCVSFLNSKL